MMIKGESRGHCQACGRVQVVLPGGTMAKHGYRVAGFGFFNGTCLGSSAEPLQRSRILTDAIIKMLTNRAARNEVRAMALRAGTLKPEQAQSLSQRGEREWRWVGEGRERGREPIMKAWALATVQERKAQVALDASEYETDARHSRAHAKDLAALALAIHGTPLIDRAAEKLARKAERAAKSAPIEGAFRTKAAQKDALDKLNRAYGRHRKTITELCLSKRDAASDLVYWKVPFDLHCWREAHSALVGGTYPELVPTVRIIESLLAERNEIKARPVIK